jgi:hypothetical protein
MIRTSVIQTFIVLTFGLIGTAIQAQPASLQDLRMIRQIPSWHEDSASYRPYSPDDLFDLIDGAAPEYIDNGLVKGFFQRLDGPDSATLEVFVDDFGSAANAQTMFHLKRQTVTDPCSIAGPDTASFCAGTVIGGLVAYGRLDHFYLELVLTGIKHKETTPREMVRIFEYYHKAVGGF